ncbi:MAG: TIGR02300 family protein [Rickettsiales bacterium]|jgi:uncharacterized protein (TIGR02300 family)|nr:TIGR02300 family protein [Rickettsiales bacterium]
MARDARGKKHVCPYCAAMFYDMGREPAVCPKCGKTLSSEAELEFIKRKKKAEVRPKDDKMDVELEVGDEGADSSESEMFFDSDGEDGIAKNGGRFDDEY